MLAEDVKLGEVINYDKKLRTVRELKFRSISEWVKKRYSLCTIPVRRLVLEMAAMGITNGTALKWAERLGVKARQIEQERRIEHNDRVVVILIRR